MNQILKFKTIYKSVIWGGRRIADFKGIAPQGDHVGESWELSPMEGNESVVAEGPFKGRGLNSLIAGHGDEIMGHRLMEKYSGRFPLLIKFIDSTDDLSVQVHPDDDLAARRHNGSLGKTEMWYSVMPAGGAYLYAGFSRKLNPATFRDAVARNTIIDSLRRYDTRRGDVFFLPAGRIHSIGRGNFVLEIQEASDITYRIYDYDRRDAEGNPRQLHIEESVDAIDFDDVDSGDAAPCILPEAGLTKTLASCSYFTTCITGVDGDAVLDLSGRDSFTVAIATEGRMTLTPDGGGMPVDLPCGTTVLIPASVHKVGIDGRGSLVTVFVP